MGWRSREREMVRDRRSPLDMQVPFLQWTPSHFLEGSTWIGSFYLISRIMSRFLVFLDASRSSMMISALTTPNGRAPADDGEALPPSDDLSPRGSLDSLLRLSLLFASWSVFSAHAMAVKVGRETAWSLQSVHCCAESRGKYMVSPARRETWSRGVEKALGWQVLAWGCVCFFCGKLWPVPESSRLNDSSPLPRGDSSPLLIGEIVISW